LPDADKIFNAKNNLIFPGFIDVHTHMRDSTLEYKENFVTGTSAAVAGGFTTILDMPNTVPPITSVKELIHRKHTAKNTILCNMGFYCSPLSGKDIKELINEGAIGFKIYLHKPFEDQDLSNNNIMEIMLEIKKNNSILCVHAEDYSFSGNSESTSSNKAEVLAINKIINLVKQINCKIHFAHISTHEGLEIIKKHKNVLNISCEATPHHALLDKNDASDNFGYCEPKLKDKTDRESILKGIIDGSIDIVATDHAPHTIAEKKNLKKPGFPGLETTIPILMDLHDKKIISLKRIYETLIANPINRFNLKGIGKLMPGYKADLVIIDPTRVKEIEPSKFFSKAKYSPFDGKKFKGVIMSTFVNGQLVFNEGQIIAKPGIGNIIQQSRESQ